MNFRDLMAEDIENIFNSEELERDCTWNGATLRIIEDARSEVLGDSGPGLTHRVRRVYCRSWSFPQLPMSGQDVEIDGETWQVFDARPMAGLLAITLVREASQ